MKMANKVHLSIFNMLTGWQTDRIIDESNAYRFINGLPDFCCRASRAGLICCCWFEIKVSDTVERGEYTV